MVKYVVSDGTSLRFFAPVYGQLLIFNWKIEFSNSNYTYVSIFFILQGGYVKPKIKTLVAAGSGYGFGPFN